MLKEEHNDLCVGIDLGTTNSAVATCRVTDGMIYTPIKKVARFVDAATSAGKMIRRNDELLPSYVFYYDTKDGRYDVYVGDYAKKQYATRPYLVAKSIKSQMGQPKVEGMQEGIPDKTPEEISARIIRHLLNDLEEFYGEKITDVVITIPANFDIAMREATLRAAEIAGINIRKENGQLNDDEILLSEPEAVMYDLINQIQRGAYDIIIDFSVKRKVMVFDIGGGTLDVTLHNVEKSTENPNIYNIETLATNRYSRVAGDTFDSKIADEMYKKYIEYYERQSPEIARRIKINEKYVLANFTGYAEELKMDIGNAYVDFKSRGRVFSDDKEFEYGGRMTNGYSSQDVMTKGEFEECIESLMGRQYKYDDYKNFENITDNENIIYPILDVLNKAARKLAVSDIKIDAVVLNGGMSRLYLIKKRLDEFFGLNTIAISDPDKSVAQGAAVYHYYLHKDSSLLHKLREKKALEEENTSNDSDSYTLEQNKTDRSSLTGTGIERGIVSRGRVLNESIYLGLRGGADRLLVSDGEQLPYVSEIVTGFRIEKGQRKVRIPVGYKVNGKFMTVASGDIEFKREYRMDTPVSIQFALSMNQILSFEAWTSPDSGGKQILERGRVMLTFGQIEVNKSRKGLLPPSGSVLVPENELASIRDLCREHDSINKRGRNPGGRKRTIEVNLRRRKESILSCGNPQEFANDITEMLNSDLQGSYAFCYNMIPLARKLSRYWEDNERLELAEICLNILDRGKFFINESSWTSIHNEAIKTVGCCGSDSQAQKLNIWKDYPKYRDALLYASANARINNDWIYQQFIQYPPCFTTSVWALGMVMRRDVIYDGVPSEGEVVNRIVEKIDLGYLSRNELVMAVIALGMICDQRNSAVSPVSLELTERAKDSILGIPQIYEYRIAVYSDKARSVAIQLINGDTLTENDEKYMLSLMDSDMSGVAAAT